MVAFNSRDFRVFRRPVERWISGVVKEKEQMIEPDRQMVAYERIDNQFGVGKRSYYCGSWSIWHIERLVSVLSRELFDLFTDLGVDPRDIIPFYLPVRLVGVQTSAVDIFRNKLRNVRSVSDSQKLAQPHERRGKLLNLYGQARSLLAD